MEQQRNIEELIRGALAPGEAGHNAPPLARVRARRYVKEGLVRDGDLIGLLAAFLNMKVKLYHAVIAFLVVWFAVLLYGGDDEARVNDNHSQPYVSSFAESHNPAAQNPTVPACIKTYVIKQ